MAMLLRFSLLLCFIYSPLLWAENPRPLTVYKYIDANGVLHLTNKPPPTQTELLYSRSYLPQPPVTPAPKPRMVILPDFPRLPAHALPKKVPDLSTIAPPVSPLKKFQAVTTDYDSFIASAATRYNVPLALIHAVIKAESNYNSQAISPKGAVGLMQLMSGTASRYGVTDRTDAAQNIEGGTRYLRDLLDLFNNDMTLAVAAYNAGENAVLKYDRQIPPYAETQAYVKRVLALYQGQSYD